MRLEVPGLHHSEVALRVDDLAAERRLAEVRRLERRLRDPRGPRWSAAAPRPSSGPRGESGIRRASRGARRTPRSPTPRRACRRSSRATSTVRRRDGPRAASGRAWRNVPSKLRTTPNSKVESAAFECDVASAAAMPAPRRSRIAARRRRRPPRAGGAFGSQPMKNSSSARLMPASLDQDRLGDRSEGERARIDEHAPVLHLDPERGDLLVEGLRGAATVRLVLIAVPWADDEPVDHPPLTQRAVLVLAHAGEGGEPAPIAEDRHPLAADDDDPGAALGHLADGAGVDRGRFLTELRSLVRAVADRRHDVQADEAQRSRRRESREHGLVSAWSVPSATCATTSA